MTAVDEAPLLEDADGAWIMLSRVAEILGMTRQNAHLMAKGGKFRTLHRVKGTDMLLVREREILTLKLERAGTATVEDLADPKAHGLAEHS